MAETTTVVNGVEELLALAGKDLGHSEWTEITQERVNQFAQATGDHQWIHVDTERAKKESPFGGPIAHGFLTLSLIPQVLPQVLTIEGFSLGVNYGCDRVRFTSPVPAGSRVRASVLVDQAAEVKGGVQLTLTCTFEIEGSERPACVATWITRALI
jgi:acyl dehydratase